MRLLSIILIGLSLSLARAGDKIKMYYKNEDLTKIIEAYSKASGQKFVVDPSVRGQVSIFIQEPISIEEAFNQLSSALAVNGFAISKQGDTMIVKSARNIQRDLIEVSTEIPSIKPERMYTWIYTVKNLPAARVNRDFRVFVSRDGELMADPSTNKLIFTDWASSLNRVAEMLREIDKPLDPATAKIVEAANKERDARRKEHSSKKSEQSKN